MVVLVSVIGGYLFERSRSKERLEMARLKAGTDEGRVAELEERVRVLERLATDKRERLKDEIEAL